MYNTTSLQVNMYIPNILYPCSQCRCYYSLCTHNRQTAVILKYTMEPFDIKLASQGIEQTVPITHNPMHKGGRTKCNIRTTYRHVGSNTKKHHRDATRLDVDAALFQWFTTARVQSIPISVEILKAEAEELSTRPSTHGLAPVGGFLGGRYGTALSL